MADTGTSWVRRWWNRSTLGALVLCALIAPLSWWAGGTSWVAVIVGTLLLPIAALATLAALLGGRHRWLTRAAVLATVLVPVVPLAGYWVPGSSRAPAPATPDGAVRPAEDGGSADRAVVVALNTRQGQADPAALAHVTADADVVILTEVALSRLDDFRGALGMRVAWSGYDVPIRASTVIFVRGDRVSSPRPVQDSGTPTGLAVVRGTSSDLRVIGTRLANPAFQPPVLWDEGFRAIGGQVRAADTPAVVLGDLNAPVTTIRYRRFVRDAGLSECSDQLGLGLPGTWSPVQDGAWAPLMIDHVLTRGATCESFASVRVPGSDHRAVVATIRW